MSISRIDLFKYLPAIVVSYPSIGMCVEYFVRNPKTGTMERKRLRLQRVVKRMNTYRERRLYAQNIADQINERLSDGWTPVSEYEDSRLHVSISVMVDDFIRCKQLEGLRKRTLECYMSFSTLFVTWCKASRIDDGGTGFFRRADAVRYMDTILKRRRSNRSYNNTLKFLRCLFQWALEHSYCKENVFAGLKMLKKEPKKRILIDQETRARIAEYFDATRPQMGIVARLVYSSAMRPKEIACLKVKHVRFDERCILVEPDIAKNGHARFATINDDLLNRLHAVADGVNKEWFLFGEGKQILPGIKQVSHSYFGKVWDKMRKDLNLPQEMQLYSLRDTGLVDLLHAGIDPLTVRQHADHSSLAMQDIYTSHYDPDLNRKIYESGVKF